MSGDEHKHAGYCKDMEEVDESAPQPRRKSYNPGDYSGAEAQGRKSVQLDKIRSVAKKVASNQDYDDPDVVDHADRCDKLSKRYGKSEEVEESLEEGFERTKARVKNMGSKVIDKTASELQGKNEELDEARYHAGNYKQSGKYQRADAETRKKMDEIYSKIKPGKDWNPDAKKEAPKEQSLSAAIAASNRGSKNDIRRAVTNLRDKAADYNRAHDDDISMKVINKLNKRLSDQLDSDNARAAAGKDAQYARSRNNSVEGKSKYTSVQAVKKAVRRYQKKTGTGEYSPENRMTKEQKHQAYVDKLAEIEAQKHPKTGTKVAIKKVIKKK